MRILATVLALVAVTGSSTAALAQDDTNASILHAANEFLRALNEKDPELQASVTTADGTIAWLAYQDGKPVYRTRSFAEGLAPLTNHEGDWYEVYWEPTVLVRGDIAVVWAEYSFDVDGQRSHCGIDVFNLMRIDGDWKVTGIQFTMEPDNCPEGR